VFRPVRTGRCLKMEALVFNVLQFQCLFPRTKDTVGLTSRLPSCDMCSRELVLYIIIIIIGRRHFVIFYTIVAAIARWYILL
jgi:hypothetical protein